MGRNEKRSQSIAVSVSTSFIEVSPMVLFTNEMRLNSFSTEAESSVFQHDRIPNQKANKCEDSRTQVFFLGQLSTFVHQKCFASGTIAIIWKIWSTSLPASMFDNRYVLLLEDSQVPQVRDICISTVIDCIIIATGSYKINEFKYNIPVFQLLLKVANYIILMKFLLRTTIVL